LNAAGQRRGGLRIAGHDVDRRLLALEDIEAGLAELPDRLADASGFRVVDDWLVSEALLRARLGSLPFSRTARAGAPIPGQPARGRVACFRRLVSSRRVLSRSSACAIFFRTNVRAFYAGEAPVTLWMAGDGRRVEDLVRALQVRERAAGSSLRTPRILCQRLHSAPAYVLEETILGRNFGELGDWRRLADALIPALFGFYDRGGIRHRLASELFDAPALEEQLAALTGDLESDGAWKRRWVPRRELLAACADCLRREDATMPLCTGHGDLSKTNFLVAHDGAIVVVDWDVQQAAAADRGLRAAGLADALRGQRPTRPSPGGPAREAYAQGRLLAASRLQASRRRRPGAGMLERKRSAVVVTPRRLQRSHPEPRHRRGRAIESAERRSPPTLPGSPADRRRVGGE
jgi:hypothetical protein